MAQSGIFNILPTDYQLYLESMLPYMNEVPIGREYFNKEMEDQIIDSTLHDYFKRFNDSPGAITENEYMTDKYPTGTNDPNSPTGFNELFHTLGNYMYEINPPAAGADPSVTVKDRYDWNPAYTEYGYDDDNTGDVTTPMFAKFLWNTRPTKLGGTGFDFANTAEMAGNYFGHRQSEGQGRDVNVTIPINNETFKNYTGENFGNLSELHRPLSSNQISNMLGNTSPMNRPVVNQPPKGAVGFNTGGIASLVI
jgi:hypothetical protein|tara:strand:+ start:60 stop:815 length:756 start_codon:yes stop_codon:yes gene_type:complete